MSDDTTTLPENFDPPCLGYLHGFQDALEVAFAIAWDLQGNPEAPALVTDRLEKIRNDIRGRRLEAAARAAGADDLRGYWEAYTEPGDYWPVA